MILTWSDKVDEFTAILKQLSFRDTTQQFIACDDGYLKIKRMLLDVREQSKTVYVIGNGASASMASHFSADLAKNGQLHTQVFSDLALITAISNDMSYDEVFAEPLRRRGQKGDLLVAISSSGQSPNILAAIDVARQLDMNVVTLSAMNEDNKLRQIGDVNIYIPAPTYGAAESGHGAILHHWIDSVVESDYE